MGSIDIIKAMSTVISSTVHKSQQHQEKNSWECGESNLGLLDEMLIEGILFFALFETTWNQSWDNFKVSGKKFDAASRLKSFLVGK